MYTYSEYVSRQIDLQTGLAGLVLLALLITGLVAMSKPAQTYISRVGIRAQLPNIPLPYTLLLAAVLRLPKLFDPLWYDETFSAGVASVSFQDLHRVILSDVHPPLPYLVEWVTFRLIGSEEWALRLPSLIFGLSSIVLIYHIARRCGLSVYGARTAALLLALLPVHIQYSTEARGYTLLMCVVLFVLLSILENKKRRFMLAALLGFIHAQGFIYLAVLGLIALIERRWHKQVFAAGAVAALWLPVAYLQSGDVSNGFWLTPLSAGGSLSYFLETSIGLAVSPVAGLIAYAAIVPVTALALYQWIKSKQRRTVLAVYIGVPMLTAAVSLLWHNVYMARSLLPAGVLVCVLWAYLITKPQQINLYKSLVIPALLIGTIGQIATPSVRFDDWINCGGKDIWTGSTHLAIIAKYYNPDATIYLWSQANDRSQELSSDAKAALGFVERDTPPLGACIIHHDNPLAVDWQRDYIQQFLPPDAVQVVDKDIYKLWVSR